MHSDGSALQRLSRDECLTLMASVPVGRIVYTRRALPAVELVNFALDHGDIVIRTDRSGKLAAATRGAVVAFEADQLDLDLLPADVWDSRRGANPNFRRYFLRAVLGSEGPRRGQAVGRGTPGAVGQQTAGPESSPAPPSISGRRHLAHLRISANTPQPRNSR